jgi:hypothetical protein
MSGQLHSPGSFHHGKIFPYANLTQCSVGSLDMVMQREFVMLLSCMLYLLLCMLYLLLCMLYLLLRMFRSVYSASCCSVHCLCKCVLDYCHRDIGALSDYPNWGFYVLFLICKASVRDNSQRRGTARTWQFFSFYCYVYSGLCILCTVCV